jgi:hypothetical protein
MSPIKISFHTKNILTLTPEFTGLQLTFDRFLQNVPGELAGDG